MHPIDGRSLPNLLHDADKGRIERFARAVSKRTGTYPWWNELNQAVHFCLRSTCEVAIIQSTVYRLDGTFHLPDDDQVCNRIYRGRIPARRKDALIEQSQRDAKSEAMNAYHRAMDHSRTERLKEARRLLQLQESGGLSRPMVTV